MSVFVVSVFVVSVLVVSVFGGGAVVSVGGGGASVDVVSVGGGGVGRRRGCGVCDGGTVAVVIGPELLIIGGGCVETGAREGMPGGVVAGKVPAIVAGCWEPSGAGLSGSVKFVVVSTAVSVKGGGVSPGALMVDVTPLACPSWTT